MYKLSGLLTTIYFDVNHIVDSVKFYYAEKVLEARMRLRMSSGVSTVGKWDAMGSAL